MTTKYTMKVESYVEDVDDVFFTGTAEEIVIDYNNLFGVEMKLDKDEDGDQAYYTRNKDADEWELMDYVESWAEAYEFYLEYLGSLSHIEVEAA